MNRNTRFYIAKSGDWNESPSGIDKTTYSARQGWFPKAGDYYLRLNPVKKTIMIIRFNGESEHSFDMNFGAGLESHEGEHIVGIEKLMSAINNSPDKAIVEANMNMAFQSAGLSTRV
jgi:hypothetical protein